MVIRLIIAALIVALISPAMAQTKTPDLTPLLQTIQRDAKASLDDANAHEDKIAAACHSAVFDAVTAKLQAQAITGGGLILAFQKFRDITRLNASPQGTALILGCAPLAQDARMNLLDLFTKFGATVLLKGVLVP